MMDALMAFILFALFVDYFYLKQQSKKWPKVRNPFYVDD